MGDQSIPVTVISGVLGAGKTTLLNNVLAQATDQDLAVLVNDMGEVNIDAELVADAADIAEADEELVELSNGCICCELKGDLLEAIDRLTRTGDFDGVVVESTGVAEPLPVAQSLTLGFDGTDLDPEEFYDQTGIEPLEQCHLDTTVTVVDAHQFADAIETGGTVTEAGQERPLADLIIEQVEFCDVLVLNKCDLVAEDELDQIEATLQTLQPRAEIIRTTHGDIAPETIIDTGRFDFEAASQSAGWIEELKNPHESAEDEHGVTSFVFEASRPFHPERLATLFTDMPASVVRSKGHFWLAGRDEMALSVDVAGQSVRVVPAGLWIAALPPEEQEAALEERPAIAEEWDDQWGDRGTRLVVIGVEMDHEEVREQLETCVLTTEEMEADWESFSDPFPTFQESEDSADTAEQGSSTDEEPGTEDQADATGDDRQDGEEVGIAD